MKVLTARLGQFAFSALLLTIMFRYVLHLCIGNGNSFTAILCAVVYFGLMFFTGWYFGGKDVEENGIHDIGFRFHLVTYILCIGCGYAAGGVGWNAEPLRSIMITAISWGIGLLVHFVCFLVAQKNSIKGYAREEIFQ